MEEKEIGKAKHLILAVKKTGIFVFAGLCIFFGFVPLAHSASLYIAPIEKTINVGDTFPLQIYASSPEKAMNAVSATIRIPTETLEVVSLVRAGAIVGLWINEPSSVVSTGIVSLKGVILNPGYQGTAGLIVTLNVKAKIAGTAVVSFDSASILANDGLGTSILTGTQRGTYTVIPAGANLNTTTTKMEPEDKTEEKNTETPSETSSDKTKQTQATSTQETIPALPSAPKVVSNTHPNSDVWYKVRNVHFSWSVPRNVTSVRLLVNKDMNAIPTMTHASTMNFLDLSDMDDGIWYMHVRFQNSAGWGGITHYRFQIDGTKPNVLQVSEVKREDISQIPVSFLIQAEDETSGIARYDIHLDESAVTTWKDDGSHIFSVPTALIGRHALSVCAYDKASNRTCSSTEFSIESSGLSDLNIASELTEKGRIAIKGTTAYPNTKITIWMQRDDDRADQITVISDENGLFTYSPEHAIQAGSYRIWAELTDGTRVVSSLPEKVLVGTTHFFETINPLWLLLLFPIVILVILLIIFRRERYLFRLFKRYRNTPVEETVCESVESCPPEVVCVSNDHIKRRVSKKKEE
jgi:hypothetical protein